MAVGTTPTPSLQARNRIVEFGDFRANLSTGELWRRGQPVKLQDQPFRMLAMLLENAGHVVSKEELRQRLWPGDTYVNFDVGLNSCAKRLRQALGDSAETPVFFETMSRRGYRWIGPVETVGAEAPMPASILPAQAVPPQQANATPDTIAVPDAAKLARLVLVLSSVVVVLLIVLVLDVLLLHGH